MRPSVRGGGNEIGGVWSTLEDSFNCSVSLRFVPGRVRLAEAKGYLEGIGALGLLWVVGLLVLIVVPTKRNAASAV